MRTPPPSIVLSKKVKERKHITSSQAFFITCNSLLISQIVEVNLHSLLTAIENQKQTNNPNQQCNSVKCVVVDSQPIASTMSEYGSHNVCSLHQADIHSLLP